MQFLPLLFINFILGMLVFRFQSNNMFIVYFTILILSQLILSSTVTLYKIRYSGSIPNTIKLNIIVM